MDFGIMALVPNALLVTSQALLDPDLRTDLDKGELDFAAAPRALHWACASAPRR